MVLSDQFLEQIALVLQNTAELAKAAGFESGPYGPESYDAAALIMLAMEAAKSTDSNVFKNNSYGYC